LLKEPDQMLQRDEALPIQNARRIASSFIEVLSGAWPATMSSAGAIVSDREGATAIVLGGCKIRGELGHVLLVCQEATYDERIEQSELEEYGIVACACSSDTSRLFDTTRLGPVLATSVRQIDKASAGGFLRIRERILDAVGTI
jgi:hypothetical protein